MFVAGLCIRLAHILHGAMDRPLDDLLVVVFNQQTVQLKIVEMTESVANEAGPIEKEPIEVLGQE